MCIALAVIFRCEYIHHQHTQLAPGADAVSYRQGSTGSVVRQIQKKLKDQAFYFGNVDGIYGKQTTAAVKKYQSRYGLKVDGICGPQTLSALGISAGSSNSGSSDVNLLARIISAEARGEPYIGQVAVGAVVLNRIKHPSFPNSMAGVIYQPGAFTAVTDGQFKKPVSESAYRRQGMRSTAGIPPRRDLLFQSREGIQQMDMVKAADCCGSERTGFARE